MSDTENGCSAWNWAHICRLPVGHTGDHRCSGCGDVWNQGPDDFDEHFENDYDGMTCEEELGRQYTVPETPEEQRLGTLRLGAAAHDALTTMPGVRGHQVGRDRTGEPPCETCDAIDREAAALGVTWGANR